MVLGAPRDYKRLQLHRGAVVFLFFYYAVLALGAAAAALWLANQVETTTYPISNWQIVIAMSLVGSTVFYSRKLYKACIEDAYTFSEKATWNLATIGTFAFFSLRPVFGVMLSLFTYFIWRSALLASIKDGTLATNHFYISGALGFLVGFFAGRVIERFEDRGLSELDRLTGKDND